MAKTDSYQPRGDSYRPRRDSNRRHRIRTAELEVYNDDRRETVADREEHYGKASFSLTPPPHNRRDRDDRRRKLCIANGSAAIPRSTPTADAVLNTAELLEAILICLPMKDLLFSQRVCKTWKALIDNSLRLQRALFFQPAGPLPISWVDPFLITYGGNEDLAIDTSAMAEMGWPEVNETYPAHWGYSLHDAGCNRVFENPLLFDKFWSDIGIFEAKVAELHSFDRTEASWKKMFFTQPPARTVAFHSKSRSQVLRETRVYSAITMPELLSAAIEFGRHYHMDGMDQWHLLETGLDLDSVVVSSDEMKSSEVAGALEKH